MPELIVPETLRAWIEGHSGVLLVGAAGLLTVVAAMRRRARLQTPDTESQSPVHLHREVWLEGQRPDSVIEQLAPEEPEPVTAGTDPKLPEEGDADAASSLHEPQAATTGSVPEGENDSGAKDDEGTLAQATVLVVVGPTGETQRLPLPWGIVSVGRSRESTVCVEDPAIGSVHLLVSNGSTSHRITTFEANSGGPVTRPLVVGEPVLFGGSTLRLVTEEESAQADSKRGASAMIQRILPGPREVA